MKATIPTVAPEEEIWLHKLINPVTPSWFSDLDRLSTYEKDLALLPVGWGSGGKGPMLKGWPRHRGFTTDQLKSVPGIRSVGARTGISTGPLLCFDIDGATAMELAVSLGMAPWAVTTWQVHRNNDAFRLKLLFRPNLDQIKQLPNREEFQGRTLTKFGDGSRKGEALEVFFHGGRQVIVIGDHPSSGGNYFWPDGLGPEVIAPTPEAFWKHALEIAEQSQRHTAAAAGKARTQSVDTRRLNPCPICGRHSGAGNGLWCEQSSDGLIFCMPGSSFSADPSGTMKLGTVVNDYALVKRTPMSNSEGDCLTFAPHRPISPRNRIGRPQRTCRRRTDVQA